EPACQVCGATLADEGSLDLHHVSYDGVSWHETEDQWVAAEADEYLMPMCRAHHQQLHRIMDGCKEFSGWDWRRATVIIVPRLIDRHQRTEQSPECSQFHLNDPAISLANLS